MVKDSGDGDDDGGDGDSREDNGQDGSRSGRRTDHLIASMKRCGNGRRLRPLLYLLQQLLGEGGAPFPYLLRAYQNPFEKRQGAISTFEKSFMQTREMC